jgi:Spy/CpxP family protein refolding chaperone
MRCSRMPLNFVAVVFLVASFALAQAPPPQAQGPTGSAAPPNAPQGVGPGPGGPRGFGPGGMSWWEGPWWSGPFVQDLNLSETQKADIRAAVKEYRDRIVEIRTTIQKADADVETAFDDNPVDQRKANDAIERLATARGDLTRTLSQMSLKIRGILTADQWQELQRRQPGRRGGRGFGGGRFGREKGQGGPGYSGNPGSNLTKQ